MIHYHGTPLTPRAQLMTMGGECFCVSYWTPTDIDVCMEIGQSVMLDNGAFSKWKSGKETNWAAFYEWAERWLGYPTTWAVIPDVIDGGSQLQDALLREWPFGQRGAPVWHMDEPLHRLLKLTDEWPRVCVGSTAEYAVVLSDSWCRRIDEVFNAVAQRHRFMPWLHMLRGMQLSGRQWPFASVDSTDIAQNHHRPHNSPRQMADRWDALQTPGAWVTRPQQMELV